MSLSRHPNQLTLVNHRDIVDNCQRIGRSDIDIRRQPPAPDARARQPRERDPSPPRIAHPDPKEPL
ncbi:hypothetical protein GCM10027033_07170 [Leucobacter ruminantium]